LLEKVNAKKIDLTQITRLLKAWREFIELQGCPSTRLRTVPTYNEGGNQVCTQEPYYYKFKSTTNLSYVMFYEEREGKVGLD